MTPEHTWRKASHSQNNANCVELHNTLGQARDSKNSSGPALRGNMIALVCAIQAGRFDR